jgi:septal ring factor EnvC (AmiA/AmiB activator)
MIASADVRVPTRTPPTRASSRAIALRHGIRVVVLTVAVLVAGAPECAHAQSADARLRQQQQELQQLREERRTLERRMGDLQRSARSLAEEVANLDRQADATSRLVGALEAQLATMNAEVDSATGRLVRAEDELLAKRAVLQRRVVDIYKRGPLYSTEAMLSARSFGDLVSRYKYLYEVARRDRSLVARVETLRDDIATQRTRLVRLTDDLERNRSEKAREEVRLRSLEQQRAQRLTVVQRDATQMQRRLTQLARDEARLANLLATLEATRRRAEMAPNAAPAAPSTLRTADFGKLDWPVDGEILYRFGRVVNPNNTTTRWNGLGIGAAAGTPVRAVSAGEVVVSEMIGTYGLTIILQHGAGDYSVYGSLAGASVRKGATVTKGQVIGTVGIADPDLPPHLHFEIRPRGRAVDPLEWLRGQR